MRFVLPPFNPKAFKVIVLVLFLIGLGLRIYQHFMGRSLWEDEAHLALNFVWFGYQDLTKPLENFQAAPILFLFSVETFTRLFGFSEVALRSFPFLVSTAIYPLYYFLSYELTKNRLAAILSFAFMTFSVKLIEMASEVKPYTLDVSAYIGLGYLAVSQHDFVKKRRVLLLSIFGALAMLYSNVAVVSIACTAAFIMHQWSIRREGPDNKNTISIPNQHLYIFGTWAIVFLFNYFTFVHNHPYAGGMRDLWKFTFPPPEGEALTQFIEARINDTFFSDLMFMSSDYYFPYIVLLIFSVAIGNIIYQRRAGLAIFTLLPILLHFVLAAMKLYPFFFRFILDLLPVFFLLAGYGIAIIAQFLFHKAYKLVAIVFVAICCLGMLKKPIELYPKWDIEIKPALDYINRQYPNQKIYVTTPLTLLRFYLETGYLKNKNYQRLEWFISPEQYFEALKNEQSNYVLVHSAWNGDGYDAVREQLRQKGLIVNEFTHVSFHVWEIKPLEAESPAPAVSN